MRGAKAAVALGMLTAAMALMASQRSAREVDDAETRNRIEISYVYDHLNPHADYGHWNNLLLSYYRKESDTFTWFLQGALSDRVVEGEGSMASWGAYKDWSDSLYTYTQITAGSNCEYFPRFRIDHDFNFKFGERKQWVAIAGFAYIDSHDIHRDYILSPGLTYYAEKYNVTYRLFYNISDPGSETSFTHLLSIGYGREKEQWTYLDLSYGNQAYLSRDLESVDNDTIRVRLSHRHWLTPHSGVFGAVEYQDLKDSYLRHSIQLGFFKEF
jgi:YaiO family outer membrane protein